MIASRVFSTLLKHNPNAARMMLRQSHSGKVVTRNIYPRAGPNPFGEPEWFFNPVHKIMKKVMFAACVWVVIDVRYFGQFRANGTPFTIQLVNTLFPSVPKRYEHHHEAAHH
uniref:Uncharacterized protein n=1 Tax=Tetranychus urticae TaxID=32264 RepID=T1KHP4_TETUR